jgi:hypothetical protein
MAFDPWVRPILTVANQNPGNEKSADDFIDFDDIERQSVVRISRD